MLLPIPGWQALAARSYGGPGCQGSGVTGARAARGCCRRCQGARETGGPGYKQSAHASKARAVKGPVTWPWLSGGPCFMGPGGQKGPVGQGPVLALSGSPGNLDSSSCLQRARASEAQAVRGPVTGARAVRRPVLQGPGRPGGPCYRGPDGQRAHVAGAVRGPGKPGTRTTSKGPVLRRPELLGGP